MLTLETRFKNKNFLPVYIKHMLTENICAAEMNTAHKKYKDKKKRFKTSVVEAWHSGLCL